MEQVAGSNFILLLMLIICDNESLISLAKSRFMQYLLFEFELFLMLEVISDFAEYATQILRLCWLRFLEGEKTI